MTDTSELIFFGIICLLVYVLVFSRKKDDPLRGASNIRLGEEKVDVTQDKYAVLLLNMIEFVNSVEGKTVAGLQVATFKTFYSLTSKNHEAYLWFRDDNPKFIKELKTLSASLGLQISVIKDPIEQFPLAVMRLVAEAIMSPHLRPLAGELWMNLNSRSEAWMTENVNKPDAFDKFSKDDLNASLGYYPSAIWKRDVSAS